MPDRRHGSVDTGGGAYIGGSVSMNGGHFAGRDLQIHNGLSGNEATDLFASVYRQIAARNEDPRVDKDELSGTVRRIQDEAAKGETANPDKMRRLLKTLAEAAPDIFRVTAAALTNPIAGVAEGLRAIAARMLGTSEQ